jgi:hypothetical protein
MNEKKTFIVDRTSNGVGLQYVGTALTIIQFERSRRTVRNWCRCRSVETTLESGRFEYDVGCDAKAWREGDRRETATGSEVGVGKESCERPKPSSSSDVSSERRRQAAGQQASKQTNSRREYESSVTARSRCWGKAAAPNDVIIILSSSSSSPSCIVKFDVSDKE